jgi:NAD(P)-dependent dehydrogenase (short-subunit alcohol dehydrogenase family)
VALSGPDHLEAVPVDWQMHERDVGAAVVQDAGLVVPVDAQQIDRSSRRRQFDPVMRFLAAPEARWVTAQTVCVNGGMTSPIN